MTMKAGKQAVRIPVTLAGAEGVRYGREPLTFGVPFAEGALAPGARLRCVTADGRDLPLQTSEMTTWMSDLKHVKWLLADLQADPARDGERVWLETAAQTTESTPSITATQADGLLTIDTGALRLTLRNDFPRWKKREWDSPFVGCAVKTVGGAWRETLHGPGILLYMRDQHGNLYTSLGCCPAPVITIEERGSLRVGVLITGYLMSEQGLRFCPYRLRIHLYAGKTDLRIFHTFIFDQDPTRVEIAAMGLKVLLKPGEGAKAAIGGEAQAAYTGTAAQGLSLVQTDDLNHVAGRAGATLGKGGKAAGWAALSGAEAGVVAAVYDFWQEYPKGFGIEPDALDVRIWPEDAPGRISFLTPFDEPPIGFNGTRDEEEVKRLLAARPTAPLALQSFMIKNVDDLRWVEDVIERLAPDRAKSYCDYLGNFTGIGAAKTTEIALRFSPGPVEPAAAAAFGATVREPLVGIVDPQYACAADAMGPFLPAGNPRFAELDRVLTEIFDQIMMEPQRRCRWYGMFLHGHFPNGHTMHGGANVSDLVYHLYKDKAPEKALRYIGPFGNESSDLILGFWGQFLRTGERKYLLHARRTARAVADVSFVHASPGHEEEVGCIHYHGPHAWSNGLCRSHSEVGFMVADYYLTGNRRMREVALEAADGILYDKLEPCGIVNCFARLHREFTGPLAILIEAYRLTWHEKYGDPARRSLHWLLRAVRTPGWVPISVFTGGPRGAEAFVEPEQPPGAGACNLYHVLAPALKIFPSRELESFVLAQADFAVLHGSGTGLAHAYALTRDPKYAAAALARLRKQKTEVGPDDILCFYSSEWCEGLPPLQKTVALAAEADPGFWDYAQRWMENWEKPAPAEDPNRTRRRSLKAESIGVLSTEPF